MENYTSQVVLTQPLEKVVKAFSDDKHFYKWQTHVKSLEFFEGKALEPGAKAKLVTKFGDHDDIKSVLTVDENNLPEKVVLRYDTDGVISRQTIRFKTLATNKTLCIIDSEFDTKGLMSVMTFMNPGHFKKRSEEFLENFKTYAEKVV